MNELPKSVRDELARQQHAALGHPDANLLTAFAEGTTSPVERANLEQHLAACSECREVLFLAAPDAEIGVPVIAVEQKARSRWFSTWLPWTAAGTAAAAVLLVATFTITRRTEPQMSARNESAAPAGQVSPEVHTDEKTAVSNGLSGKVPAAKSTVVDGTSLAPPMAKDADAFSDRRDKQIEKLNELKKEKPSSPQADLAVAGGMVKPNPAPLPATASGQTRSDQYAYKAPAQNTFPRSGPAAPAQNQMNSNQATNQSANQNRASSQDSLAGNSASEIVEVLQQAEVVQSAKVARQIPAEAGAYSLKRSRTNYRISAAGQVERLEAGNWKLALAQAGTKFKVVAVIGPIVWAGGSGGTLVRSMDNGASWQSIHLPNIAAEATITKIEFHDAFNGKVSASGQHTWTTRDRGETWQQP